STADIHYELSLALLACKERTISEKEFLALIEKLISSRGQLSLIEVTSKNYAEIRNEIIKLESDVYEPARQTDIAHFDHALKNRNAIAYALKGAQGLAGIIFAAPLSIFPLERGLRLD